MTRLFTVFTLVSVAVAWPITLRAQDSDQQPSAAVMQAVDAAFPQELRYVGAPPSGLGASVNAYNTCATVFNQNADGTPDLIAAAYSGHGVEIAMLAYQSGAAQIIDTVKENWPLNTAGIHEFFFVGGQCDASITNLADPGQPESQLARTVEITFGGQDWFFLWDGKQLRNITALRPGSGDPPDSNMYTTYAVDVDHRGVMQIVGNNGDLDKFPKDDGIASTGTELFFRYNGATYELAKTLLLLDECGPQPASWKQTVNGPWNGNIDEIDMHQTPAPSYQLTIVNGDRDGSNRVTSAKVEINGVATVEPTEVNQNVETLTRTIQLQKTNKIKVTVDGPAKSHLYVMVE
jgi:hypothetical protein